MTNAYQYVINQGVTLEFFYSYEQTTKSCTYEPTRMPHFSISSSNIIYGSCSDLEKILKQRPVSVVISADVNFLFYKSGILNTCGQTINHAIQLVGIIKNSASSYYIGRNSWGTEWGDGGYVYIDSTINNGNLCNVCTYPQYPIWLLSLFEYRIWGQISNAFWSEKSIMILGIEQVSIIICKLWVDSRRRLRSLFRVSSIILWLIRLRYWRRKRRGWVK